MQPRSRAADRIDPVVERMRARVRTLVAIALVALIAGVFFESSFAALLRPLTSSVSAVSAVIHR